MVYVISDVCARCHHGIERHQPAGPARDYCGSNPGPAHPFGDRELGPVGPCPCDGFRIVRRTDPKEAP